MQLSTSYMAGDCPIFLPVEVDDELLLSKRVPDFYPRGTLVSSSYFR